MFYIFPWRFFSFATCFANYLCCFWVWGHVSQTSFVFWVLGQGIIKTQKTQHNSNTTKDTQPLNVFDNRKSFFSFPVLFFGCWAMFCRFTWCFWSVGAFLHISVLFEFGTMFCKCPQFFELLAILCKCPLFLSCPPICSFCPSLSLIQTLSTNTHNSKGRLQRMAAHKKHQRHLQHMVQHLFKRRNSAKHGPKLKQIQGINIAPNSKATMKLDKLKQTRTTQKQQGN